MECIGYLLLYLVQGSLPWQGIQAKDKKAKYAAIFERKLEFSIEKMCLDNSLPIEFANYMAAVRELNFEDRPNYTELRDIFKGLFYRLGHEYDYQYDWVLLRRGQSTAAGGSTNE